MASYAAQHAYAVHIALHHALHHATRQVEPTVPESHAELTYYGHTYYGCTCYGYTY